MLQLLRSLNKRQIIRTIEEKEGLELRANYTGQEQYSEIDPETGLARTVEYNPVRVGFVPSDADWDNYFDAKEYVAQLSKEDILHMFKTGQTIVLDGEPKVF